MFLFYWQNGSLLLSFDQFARQTPSVRAGKDSANGAAVIRFRFFAICVSHPQDRLIL